MSTMEDSDEALVGRYVRGDATAFDQLYKRHELRVWRYLERNVRDQATSDELLQEIWFALSRNAVSLESATRFRTRLFTLTHDKMSSSLRERAPAAPETTSGRLTRDADGLVQAIGELPREQRESFLLQAEGQLSVGEIAEITETSIDATQNTVRQAKLQLRQVLSDGEASANPDDLSDVDQLYRRLSGADAGRPGEWVRRKVQAYSAQQAAERSVRDSSKASVSPVAVAPATPPRAAAPAARAPAPKQSTSKPWLLPVIGAGVVVVLVAIFVVPSLLSPGASVPAPPPPPVAQPAMTPPQVAQTPSSSESAPPSASQPAESEVASSPPPAAPAPPPPAANQQVTQAAPAEKVEEPRSAPAVPTTTSSTGSPRAQGQPKAKVAHQTDASPAPSAPVANNHPKQETQAAPVAAPVSSPPVQASVAPPPPPPPAPVQVASVAQPAPTSTPAPPADPKPMPPPDDFYKAAETGNMGRVQEVLDGGNVDLNTLDSKGHTALILAIERGHADVVKTLLAHGADPNKVDSHGATPKGAAQSRGNFVIIQALEKASKR